MKPTKLILACILFIAALLFGKFAFAQGEANLLFPQYAATDHSPKLHSTLWSAKFTQKHQP